MCMCVRDRETEQVVYVYAIGEYNDREIPDPCERLVFTMCERKRKTSVMEFNGVL